GADLDVHLLGLGHGRLHDPVGFSECQSHVWPPVYSAVVPPSMTSSLPVMYDDSSDARYITPYATSSAVPTRPIGRRRRGCPHAALFSSESLIMSVAIGPGCTELERILSLACWMAVDLVKMRTAPFVALYAAGVLGLPTSPATD